MSVCCRVANSPSLVIALQIEIGVGEIGLVLRLLGLGLVERRLERPRIDLDQRIAFLDELAFLEVDLVDLAVDPGADHHGVEALHGAEAGQVDRKVGLFDRGDLDGDRDSPGARFWAFGLCGRLFAVEALPAEIARPARLPRPAKPSGSFATWTCGSWVQEITNGG